MTPTEPFGCQMIKRVKKIGLYVGIGVFLDCQRSGGMADEQRQQVEFVPRADWTALLRKIVRLERIGNRGVQGKGVMG